MGVIVCRGVECVILCCGWECVEFVEYKLYVGIGYLVGCCDYGVVIVIVVDCIDGYV